MLEKDPQYFLNFSLVIAVNLRAATEDRLADLLWQGAHPPETSSCSLAITDLDSPFDSVGRLVFGHGFQRGPPRHPTPARSFGGLHGSLAHPGPRALQSVLTYLFSLIFTLILTLHRPGTAVVDTHPTNLASLRIDCPFDELVAHAESVDFDSLDSMEHGNVPFVVILIRALSEWKKRVRLF